jgi:hypothetical protein
MTVARRVLPLLIPLAVLVAAWGSASTETTTTTVTSAPSTTTLTGTTAHDQAVRLAQLDFGLEIVLPGQHNGVLNQRGGPATSVACSPAVDIRKVVTAPGTITGIYNYLMQRLADPISASGFIRDGNEHFRIVSGTLGVEPPIPNETNRPRWNGFGYGIDPGSPGHVIVEIDAFVVPAGAGCYQASSGGANRPSIASRGPVAERVASAGDGAR